MWTVCLRTSTAGVCSAPTLLKSGTASMKQLVWPSCGRSACPPFCSALHRLPQQRAAASVSQHQQWQSLSYPKKAPCARLHACTTTARCGWSYSVCGLPAKLVSSPSTWKFQQQQPSAPGHHHYVWLLAVTGSLPVLMLHAGQLQRWRMQKLPHQRLLSNRLNRSCTCTTQCRGARRCSDRARGWATPSACMCAASQSTR